MSRGGVLWKREKHMQRSAVSQVTIKGQHGRGNLEGCGGSFNFFLGGGGVNG